MNIEAYDVESVRKLVRLLEYENKRLKERLKKKISYMMMSNLLRKL